MIGCFTEVVLRVESFNLFNKRKFFIEKDDKFG